MTLVCRIRIGFILPLLLIAASCAPQRPTTTSSAPPSVQPANYPLFQADLARADAVIVARLIDAVPEKLADHFMTTARWKVVEVISGSVASSEIVTRLPFDARGWKTDGPLPRTSRYSTGIGIMYCCFRALLTRRASQREEGCLSQACLA